MGGGRWICRDDKPADELNTLPNKIAIKKHDLKHKLAIGKKKIRRDLNIKKYTCVKNGKR
jgi:hypothetical protein